MYGAGVGFGVIPRQYHKIKGERFLIYCDYPICNFKSNNYKTAVFKTLGNPVLNCRMLILSETRLKQADFTISVVSGKNEEIIKADTSNMKVMEFNIPGGSDIKIKWK